MEKLLEVKDLKVSFFTDLGETQAVKDAGFAIEEGDFFGIVGESGLYRRKQDGGADPPPYFHNKKRGKGPGA